MKFKIWLVVLTFISVNSCVVLFKDHERYPNLKKIPFQSFKNDSSHLFLVSSPTKSMVEKPITFFPQHDTLLKTDLNSNFAVKEDKKFFISSGAASKTGSFESFAMNGFIIRHNASLKQASIGTMKFNLYDYLMDRYDTIETIAIIVGIVLLVVVLGIVSRQLFFASESCGGCCLIFAILIIGVFVYAFYD